MDQGGVTKTLTSRLKHVTVEPVLFLYMFSLYLLFSSFQNLVYTSVCALKFDNVTCANLTAHEDARTAVQTETAFWTWSSTLCMTLPSIVVDCYLGAWSDTIGKKYTLLMPPIGALLGSIVYIIKGN